MNESDQNNPSQSKKVKIISIFLISLLVVIVSSVFVLKVYKYKTNKEVSAPTANPVPNWKFYKQDALGISFYYPPEWGNVRQETNYITNLETLKNDCADHNDMDDRCNSINLGFDQNNYYFFLQFRIFNNRYRGETYPNSYAGQYGSIENIPVLVDTGDICKYKISFDTPYTDKKREIYSHCKDGVKISLVETEQDFRGSSFNPPIGILYTYDLKYFSYKKLKNGMFDNVLISHTAPLSTSTSQLKSPLTSKQFFEKTNLDPLSNEHFDQFKKFVNSFNIYTPPKNNVPELVNIPAEESGVSLIRKYYQLLVDQPREAYGLVKSGFDLNQFIEKYLNKIYKAIPRDFKNLGQNEYEYWLDYQEHNKKLEIQRHIVKIENNKIVPELSETLTSTIATSTDTISYGASRGDRSVMVLNKNGQETIINSAPNDFGKNINTLIFSNIKFSKTGRYLLYSAGGWEWSFSYVYDVENKKELHKEDGAYSELTLDENLYYYCSSNDFSGNYSAMIYDVPSFKVKVDISKKFPDLVKFGTSIDCKENIEDSTIEFNFKGRYLEGNTYDEYFSKVIRVDTKTGQILNEKQP